MAFEYIGKIGDFQAEYEGSIPFTRSNPFGGQLESRLDCGGEPPSDCGTGRAGKGQYPLKPLDSSRIRPCKAVLYNA